jgi:hypothetical protein
MVKKQRMSLPSEEPVNENEFMNKAQIDLCEQVRNLWGQLELRDDEKPDEVTFEVFLGAQYAKGFLRRYWDVTESGYMLIKNSLKALKSIDGLNPAKSPYKQVPPERTSNNVLIANGDFNFTGGAYSAEEYAENLQYFVHENVEGSDLINLLRELAIGLTDNLWLDFALLSSDNFYFNTLIDWRDYGNYFGLIDLDFYLYPPKAREFFLEALTVPDWMDAKLVEIEPELYSSEEIRESWEDEDDISQWSMDSRERLLNALIVGKEEGHLTFPESSDQIAIDIMTADPEVYSGESGMFGNWWTDDSIHNLLNFDPVVNEARARQHQEECEVSYARLTQDEKMLLISRIASTLDDPELGETKISHYLLSLLWNHPETPKEGRAFISLLADEHIRLIPEE